MYVLNQEFLSSVDCGRHDEDPWVEFLIHNCSCDHHVHVVG